MINLRVTIEPNILLDWYGFDSQNIRVHQSLILALTSGLISSIVTNPLDVVKVRMQIQRAEMKEGESLEQGRYGYRNIFHGLKLVYKNEGFLGYFRGCYARIMYMSCQAALAFTVVDFFRGKILDHLENKK